MEYLIGDKNEFRKFLDNINDKDNIAILTHTDLDGLGSAIFLKKLLDYKGLSIKNLEFLDYKKEIFSNIFNKLKKNKINKIFILDINADQVNFNDFEKLREEYDVFLIDHHPINPLLKNFKNIIKTNSTDCIGLVVYDLCKDYFDVSTLNWLIYPIMISDFSYKDPKNFKMIQENNSDIKDVNSIIKSKQGQLSLKISSAIIYYRMNLKKVFDLLLNKDIKEIEKYDDVINKEVKKFIHDFKKNSLHNEKRDIYFYYFKSKYGITSLLATNLSVEKPDSVFILVSEANSNILKISARNQTKRIDMNDFIKEVINGLTNATGSGHSQASGGTILKKDLNEFKNRILNY